MSSQIENPWYDNSTQNSVVLYEKSNENQILVGVLWLLFIPINTCLIKVCWTLKILRENSWKIFVALMMSSALGANC